MRNNSPSTHEPNRVVRERNASKDIRRRLVELLSRMLADHWLKDQASWIQNQEGKERGIEEKSLDGI
jgi:hypothetical protein